ncbi:phage tail protein, partial [Avibacterium paragallinarum]
MANLLTPEFEQYITQQTVNNGTVIFDEFIFANIPALNEHNLTDYLTLSAVNDHIVHRQAVSKAGVVNQNSVVYSVTLGTEIGDWDYNFIGLINKSKKLLACAIQFEPIKKIKNKAGVQGNSITRSVLLEFSNAKTLTNINVNTQTWQIDFTLRLSGLDEKIRLTNRDMYGRAVFFDDGFLVSRKTGNIYNINAGTAYIEGVRANLPQHTEINATNLPCSIYVDVVHHCTVTGAYETEIQFLTRNKTDYLDQAAHQHYVQIIADIDSQGQITDRRLLDGRFIPNSKKSSATDSESEDTVATSKAVYDLNGIKLDKVGGEAFLKTIDYTKANGYTYSGFYRPNGDRLNNLPLNGLMMHITHPHYSTNAHARGICFAYGGLTGNTAWDIFTTAFDANGNHLGQKRIMTELGGTFTGNVTAPNLTATGLINITGNRWERVRATLPDGGYWRWEVNPASKDDPRFNFMYRFANGDTRYVAFPRVDKNETVAYQSWVEDKAKNLIPVGAVMAFPSAVQNPHGFLRCDGSTFGRTTYPALYQALGVNTLPDLRRSDVGMTAYFATDNIPEGWIAF